MPSARANSTTVMDRYVENNAFGVGEWLEFSVGYGIIDAGKATMEVRELVDMEGRPTFRIESTATSNRVFDAVYSVRDTMRTWMDAEGLFSRRFEKRTHEGDYHRNVNTVFDPWSGVAVSGKDTIPAPPFVQDILAAFYYVRTQPLQVGDTLNIQHLADRTQYVLRVIVHGRERIETPAGEFECLEIEPLLQAEGIFRQEGRVRIWVTDDRLHMPVLVRSKVAVGSIHAELTGYRFGELWDE